MFDHTHYVPILKGKEGEFSALRALKPKTKDSLTPLIEVPPIPWDFESEKPAKSIDGHLEPIAAKLIGAVGEEKRFFVDLLWVQDSQVDGAIHPLDFVLGKLRQQNGKAIPVTGIDRDEGYQEAIRRIVHEDGRGICLRVQSNSFEEFFDGGADDLLESLDITAADADLIIDLKAIGPDQSEPIAIAALSVVRSIPNINEWRSLTFAASAFPQNLIDITARTIETITRAEWLVWGSLRGRRLPRRPTFGDYAIAHPEPSEVDPRIIQMSANIRYTIEREWMIIKTRGARHTGFEQFRDLCRALVNTDEYAGADFSWGDSYINSCAAGSVDTGNATTWRRVGMNHHLTLVVDQISSLGAS